MKVSVKVKVHDDSARLKAAKKKATITSLGHAAGYIRKVAVNSIRRRRKPSAPGQAPHSGTGVLKRGIAYGVDEGAQTAAIGPTRSAIGLIGATHEFGGTEPPKKKGTRTPRFDLTLGGHGPIRNLSAEGFTRSFQRLGLGGQVRPWKKGDELLVVELTTDWQVEAARRVADTIPPSQGGPPSKVWRKYPPRPFMGPALVRARGRLPSFWANSIKGG